MRRDLYSILPYWTGDLRLAAADLSEAALTELPSDWLPYQIAKQRFRVEWCARQGLDAEVCGPAPRSGQEPTPHLKNAREVWCGKPEHYEGDRDGCDQWFAELDTQFLRAWKTERETARAALPRWSHGKPGEPESRDLRRANLQNAILTEADLRNAQMEGADLSFAQMEGADLSRAQMEGADLRLAQMEGAVLSGAQMEGAFLSGAQMEGANLSRAQMEGAVLIEAQMEGADLSEAQMEGAVLIAGRRWRGRTSAGRRWRGRPPLGADGGGGPPQMEGAVLSEAQMEGANLRRAQMEVADLRWAQMEGADLRRAQMEGADLRWAQMEGADLARRGWRGRSFARQMEGAVIREARMEGAVLSGARMEGADLRGAQMEGAFLSRAQMEGANLTAAQMEGAVLSYSLLTGRPDAPTILQSTNLSAGINNGGALRFVDLGPAEIDSKTDFRLAFLDESVGLPPDWEADRDNICNWLDREITDDAAFFGAWRAWVEALEEVSWFSVAPIGWERGDLPGENSFQDGCLRRGRARGWRRNRVDRGDAPGQARDGLDMIRLEGSHFMRLMSYNIEWFDDCFEDDNSLKTTAEAVEQIDGVAAVLGAVDPDLVGITEGPNTTTTTGVRDTVKALEGFAAAKGLRQSKAMFGFPSAGRQEIAVLYDPAVATVKHAPGGKAGHRTNPKFNEPFQADSDGDGIAEVYKHYRPPLEAKVTRADGGADFWMIVAHAKSKGIFSAMDKVHFDQDVGTEPAEAFCGVFVDPAAGGRVAEEGPARGGDGGYQ